MARDFFIKIDKFRYFGTKKDLKILQISQKCTIIEGTVIKNIFMDKYACTKKIKKLAIKVLSEIRFLEEIDKLKTLNYWTTTNSSLVLSSKDVKFYNKMSLKASVAISQKKYFSKNFPLKNTPKASIRDPRDTHPHRLVFSALLKLY